MQHRLDQQSQVEQTVQMKINEKDKHQLDFLFCFPVTSVYSHTSAAAVSVDLLVCLVLSPISFHVSFNIFRCFCHVIHLAICVSVYVCVCVCVCVYSIHVHWSDGLSRRVCVQGVMDQRVGGTHTLMSGEASSIGAVSLSLSLSISLYVALPK